MNAQMAHHFFSGTAIVGRMLAPLSRNVACLRRYLQRWFALPHLRHAAVIVAITFEGACYFGYTTFYARRALMPHTGLIPTI